MTLPKDGNFSRVGRDSDGMNSAEMWKTLRAYFKKKDGPKDSSGARAKKNREELRKLKKLT